MERLRDQPCGRKLIPRRHGETEAWRPEAATSIPPGATARRADVTSPLAQAIPDLTLGVATPSRVHQYTIFIDILD